MEIEQLKQKSNRMFILVCLNFVMLAVIFFGSGYVLWQSVKIVNSLKEDLATAELAMVEIREGFQQLDVDAAMDRVVTDTTEKLKASVSTALQESDLGGPLTELSQKVQGAQEKLEQTTTAIVEISERLKNIETEELAQLVSYNMLKGLGEGFSEAAESRKP